MGEILHNPEEGCSARDLLRAKKSEVLEGLRPLFEEEFEEIAVSIEDKIKRISAYQQKASDYDRIVTTSLETWQDTKLKRFAYGRYENLMKTQGRKDEETYSFLYFLTSSKGRGGVKECPYDRWRDIEARNIKVGTKVKNIFDKDPTNVSVVTGISIDCCLLLDTKGGPKRSVFYEVVEGEKEIVSNGAE